MQIEETAGTPNKFVVLRQEALADRTLNIYEKLVYARIAAFDTYFESAEACADFLGISKSHVEKAKRTLEKAGYIRCVDNTGRGKQYQAVYDLPNWKTRPSKMKGQTFQNEHIRPSKMEDIDKRLKENINNTHVGTAKAAPTCAPEAYELAELLHRRILANKPNRKIDNSWRDKWALAIDRLHRLDNRGWKEIETIIVWSQEDPFWWRNILSGEKLRQQFDTLEDQYADKRQTFVRIS